MHAFKTISNCLAGSFIHKASLSAEGCSEFFKLHVPTLGMSKSEVEEWVETDRREQQEQAVQTHTSVTAHVTRPLLTRELLWHMSQDEFDRLQAQDRERRIKEAKRVMGFGDKQRRKYNEELKARRQEEREQEAIYEEMLAKEYRKQRLSRLSDEVRQQLDLDTEVRDRVHI